MNLLQNAFSALYLLLVLSAISFAQTSQFTYQGKLTDAGVPANGQYDLTFKLFNLASGGTQIGSDVALNDVQVTAGVFSVNLDFGSSPFTTATGNYLEIAVRPGASSGAFTILSPRQLITSSPYAVQTIRAATAAVADNAVQLGGVNASQFVQTADPRLSDSRTPTAGSASYIQNQNSVSQPGNFTISGQGTANILQATQFNIGGTRVFGVRLVQDGNTSAGNAGDPANGFGNSFFGSSAGSTNTTGINNSFFGLNAGSNTNNDWNSFFGAKAGQSSNGTFNSFFGGSSGQNNSIGDNNSFFGLSSGFSNTVGSNNTIIGASADLALPNLTFATALGAGAVVSNSNTIALGRNIDTVQLAGALSVNGVSRFSSGVGIGTVNPSARLSVVAPGTSEITGAAQSSTFRTTAGSLGTTAGDELSLASIGFLTGNNSSLGIRGRRISAGNGWTTTAIGLGMDVDDTVRAGDATVWLHANGNVGIGQSNPTDKLTVEGVVQSRSGGFKFPDGSVQTTAAPNTTYTTVGTVQLDLVDPVNINHLNLPTGTYIIFATILFNNAGNFGEVVCSFVEGNAVDGYQLNIPGGGFSQTMTMHAVLNITSSVNVSCHQTSAFNDIFVYKSRLTAVRIGGSVIVQ